MSFMSFRNISPADADAGVRSGEIRRLIDVRPPEERKIASVPVAYSTFDDGGLEQLLTLPKDMTLAFLCHHGGRSAQAAMHFSMQGFTDVYNVTGGIDAWSLTVDAEIPRY